MSASGLVAALGLYAGTFAVAALSSVVPLVAIEVFLAGIVVALGPPPAAIAAIVLLAAAGQVLGKLPIYYAARGAAGLSGPHRARIERLRAWVARYPSRRLVLASSTVLGLPPFSLAATAAGALDLPVRTFCAVVFAGRALRFALLAAAAALAT